MYSHDHTFKKKTIDNFWILWVFLFQNANSWEHINYKKQLLLDINWGGQENDWEPLHGKKGIYLQMVKDFGNLNAQHILNVLSTVGDKTFLPDGLIWIVEILKKEPSQLKVINSLAAERFVQRLFYNHITEIKSNKKLVNDFVWFLDRMVDYGSSVSYMFRENVITYKSKT